MKKAISLILCFGIFSSMVVKAEENVKFYLADSFESVITNDSPSNGTYTGKDVHVVENGDGNKAVSVTIPANGKASFEYSLGETVNPDITLDMSMKVIGEQPNGTISTVNSVGRTVTMLKTSKWGVTLPDGYNIGGIPSDKSKHFQVTYSKNNIDVKVDEKQLLESWYCKNLSSNYKSVKFEFTSTSAKDTTIIIDSIYVYSGNAVGSYPEEKYNTESKEFISEDSKNDNQSAEEGEVGDDVFFVRTFDEEGCELKTSFSSIAPKLHTLELAKDLHTGNQYVNFNRNGATGDAHVDWANSSINGKKRRFIFEADTRRVPGVTVPQFINLKGVLINIDATGQIICDGKILGKVSENKRWTNIKAALNYSTKKYDVWIDGELKGEQLNFDDKDQNWLSSFRWYFHGTGVGEIQFDNIFIYEGKEPKENFYEWYLEKQKEEEQPDTPSEDEQEGESIAVSGEYDKWPAIYTHPDQAIEAAKGRFAISLLTSNYIVNDKKKTLNDKVIVENGITVVPINELASAFGLEFKMSDDKSSFTLSDKVSYTFGNDKITVNGSEINVPEKPFIKGEAVYFPLRFLGETVLGKVVQLEKSSLVIIGDDELEEKGRIFREDMMWADTTGTYTNIWDIYNYLSLDWVSADDIINMFNTHNVGHPRVMADKKLFDEIKERYKTNEKYKEKVDEFLKLAKEKTETYERIEMVLETAGGESQYLDEARAILYRALVWGFAYQLTGDKIYPETLWLDLKVVGDSGKWDVNHRIDIAEFAMGYAIAYDWMYDYWTDEQKDYIYKVSDRESFSLMEQSLYNWSALNEHGLTNNRGQVNEGATGVWACAMFERDPQRFAEAIRRSAHATASTMRGWYPGGVWAEGSGYSDYTESYYTKQASTIINTLGTDLGITRICDIDKISYGFWSANLGVGSNNHSDTGGMGFISPRPWFGYYFNDPVAKSLKVYNGNGGLFLCSDSGVDDFLWFDMDYYDRIGEADAALDIHVPGRETPVVTMRSEYNRYANVVSVTAGDVSAPHGHADVGAFIVDMDGIRWVVDPGADAYLTGADQRELYRKRTEAHSCLVINPDKSLGQDEDGRGDFVKFETGNRNAFTVIDMSKAYKSSASSVKRGIMLGDDRHTVTIRDEMQLKGRQPVYWFLPTDGEIEIANSHTAYIKKNNKVMRAELLSSSKEAKFEVMKWEMLPTSPERNPLANDDSAKEKLFINFEGSGEQYIEVRLMMEDDVYYNTEMMDMPIDNWSIDNGELKKSPKALDITMEGQSIGFNPNEQNYIVDVDGTGYESHTFEAVAPEGSYVEIRQPKDCFESAYITVHDNEIPAFKTEYKVTFKLKPVEPDLSTLQELKINNLDVTDTPQAENVKENMLDNDFSTRWSAESKQTVSFELDKVYNISHLAFSTMSGNIRSMYFNVEVSTDGKNWEGIYDSMSSGTTEGLEYYNMRDKEAKYVKLNVSGTTLGTWNSITELKIFTKK